MDLIMGSSGEEDKKTTICLLLLLSIESEVEDRSDACADPYWKSSSHKNEPDARIKEDLASRDGTTSRDGTMNLTTRRVCDNFIGVQGLDRSSWPVGAREYSLSLSDL